MVERIAANGGLSDPAWRAAFADVPRHLFVASSEAPSEDTLEESGEEPGEEFGLEESGEEFREDLEPGAHLAPGPDPYEAHAGGWWGRRARLLAEAYADRPIATRVVGGELVSSSSQPSLMALMCEALEVREGQRVLEIGAGTGYNAALLAHRLGPGTVTTIDLEPEITSAARAHLDAYGTPQARSVAVVTGDGALGWPPNAPYDRIMATCELPSVPPAWLEQCAPGGLVLAPVATGLVLLRVAGPGCAEGRFLDTPAYFVPLRGGGAGAATAPFDAGARADRTRYGLSVDGPRQWIWRDRPDGPRTWPLTAPGAPDAPGGPGAVRGRYRRPGTYR
nr:methyltransferase domain-containing protein [Actinacidiphila yeochonensis]